jgi:hypothetical protein
MQYINALRVRGYVDDSKCARSVSQTNLPNARTNAWHRLPVIRIKSGLNAKQLMPAASIAVGGNDFKSALLLPCHTTFFLAALCAIWNILTRRLLLAAEIIEQMLSIETLSWLLTVSQAAKNVGTLHLNPIHALTLTVRVG